MPRALWVALASCLLLAAPARASEPASSTPAAAVMALTRAVASGGGGRELAGLVAAGSAPEVGVIAGQVLGWRVASVQAARGQGWAGDHVVVLEIHDASPGALADWSRYAVAVRQEGKAWRIVSIAPFTAQDYGLDESVCGGSLDWQTPSQATPEAAVCTYCWALFDRRLDLAREVAAPGACLDAERISELEGCAPVVLAPRPRDWSTLAAQPADSAPELADVVVEVWGDEYRETFVMNLQRQDYRWRIASIRPAGGAPSAAEPRP